MTAGYFLELALEVSRGLVAHETDHDIWLLTIAGSLGVSTTGGS